MSLVFLSCLVGKTVKIKSELSATLNRRKQEWKHPHIKVTKENVYTVLSSLSNDVESTEFCYCLVNNDYTASCLKRKRFLTTSFP